MLAGPNSGFLATTSSIDEQTSQTNLADLMASQSSPVQLNAAYDRAESRCLQSMSRPPSPCSFRSSREMNYIAGPSAEAPLVFPPQAPYAVTETAASVAFYPKNSFGSPGITMSGSKAIWGLEGETAVLEDGGYYADRSLKRASTW